MGGAQAATDRFSSMLTIEWSKFDRLRVVTLPSPRISARPLSLFGPAVSIGSVGAYDTATADTESGVLTFGECSGLQRTFTVRNAIPPCLGTRLFMRATRPTQDDGESRR